MVMRKLIISLLAMVVAGSFMVAPSSQTLTQQTLAQDDNTIFIDMFEISEDEHRFNPDEIHLTIDKPVRLVFVNTGEEQHEFVSPLFTAVEEINVQVETFTQDAVQRNAEGLIIGLDEDKVKEVGIRVAARSILEVEVQPGHAVSLEFTLNGPFFEGAERDYAASFFLVCLEEGHLEGGMKGTIIIDPLD